MKVKSRNSLVAGIVVLACIALAVLCQSGSAKEYTPSELLGLAIGKVTEQVDRVSIDPENVSIGFDNDTLNLAPLASQATTAGKNLAQNATQILENSNSSTILNNLTEQAKAFGEEGRKIITPLANNVTQFIEENNSSMNLNNLTDNFGKELETIQFNGSENISAPIEEVKGIVKVKRLGT